MSIPTTNWGFPMPEVGEEPSTAENWSDILTQIDTALITQADKTAITGGNDGSSVHHHNSLYSGLGHTHPVADLPIGFGPSKVLQMKTHGATYKTVDSSLRTGWNIALKASAGIPCLAGDFVSVKGMARCTSEFALGIAFYYGDPGTNFKAWNLMSCWTLASDDTASKFLMGEEEIDAWNDESAPLWVALGVYIPSGTSTIRGWSSDGNEKYTSLSWSVFSS